MLCCVITNSNHVIHFLTRKLIYRFRTVTRDVNADLAHDCDRMRTHVARVQSGAEDFEAIARGDMRALSDEQIERTRREIEKTMGELAAMDAKLANEQFTKNAPAHIVAGAEARQAELRARLEKLQQNQ